MILKDKRIFITEDNLTNRSVIQFLLEQQGALIEFERWGRDAAKNVQEFMPVDIILLDLMFPDGISGYDVYDELRAVNELKKIPIVAVSAKEPEIEIPKAQDKGFSGYISKPINRMTFAQQIASIINGENIWDFGQGRM